VIWLTPKMPFSLLTFAAGISADLRHGNDLRIDQPFGRAAARIAEPRLPGGSRIALVELVLLEDDPPVLVGRIGYEDVTAPKRGRCGRRGLRDRHDGRAGIPAQQLVAAISRGHSVALLYCDLHDVACGSLASRPRNRGARSRQRHIDPAAAALTGPDDR